MLRTIKFARDRKAMKFIMSLPFVYRLLFHVLLPEDHGRKTPKELPVISYRNNTPVRNANVIPPREPGERGYNASPAEQEEMRRRRNIERAANLTWIKECVKKYSPGAWFMLTEYEKLPESTEIPTTDDAIATAQKAVETFQYLRGRSRIDLLASMETNVHEITHAYFDQNVYRFLRDNKLKLNTANAQGYIYISPSKYFYVTFPLKTMFPSGDACR